LGNSHDEEWSIEKLKNHPRPVVIDFWAPWCAPCRAQTPALMRAAKQFNGQVDLIKVNVDRQPELAQEFRVMGIPTLGAYSQGQVVTRRTGVQSEPALDALFSAARDGRGSVKGVSNVDRFMRIGAGLAVAAIGWFVADHNLWLVAAGGAIAFTGVYDRCPVFQAFLRLIKKA